MGAQNPIHSTRTTFEVVEKLVEIGGGTVSDLASELSVTKGTVHNHLSTLHELGYVTKRDDEYHPSLRFFLPASGARDQTPLTSVSSAGIQELAETTGQRADLVVREDDRAILARTELGSQYSGTRPLLGISLPLHSSAPGKAILAHADHIDAGDVLDGIDGDDQTENATTDPDELRAELRTVRREGLAHDHAEYNTDIRGIAAPIFESGQVRGAVGVVGMVDDMQGKTIQQDIPGLVISASEQLTRELEQR